MADGWRTEADDTWLSTHRSDNFARLRRRISRTGVLADALSHAELGPFAGAPRRPRLKLDGKGYSAVRYATHRITYTAIHVYRLECRRCGLRLVEAHRATCTRADGVSVLVGTVRMCRGCQPDSWLFFSRMPSTVRARARTRKVVL